MSREGIEPEETLVAYRPSLDIKKPRLGGAKFLRLLLVIRSSGPETGDTHVPPGCNIPVGNEASRSQSNQG